MEKHPQITLKRIDSFIKELSSSFWPERLPLTVSIYQCAEPISYAEAVQQEYTPVQLGCPWGPVWSTAWFHVTGEYPAAWAGSTVSLLMDTSSEALIWQHAAPAQGLDCNRNDFMLTPCADGAGAVDLYIEAAGNDLFGMRGVDTSFTLKQAEIGRFDQEIWDLYHDMHVLFDMAKKLPEESNRRANLLFVLNKAVNSYRIGGEGSVAATRQILQEELGRPAVSSASRVCACGHSHIDTAWLWPIRETKRKCSRTFSTVLKYMESYPEYRFTQSQPQLYAYVKENYPALYERIKQAVAEGRWEPQGGMWVEADCNITSGESLVRQFVHGLKFFREEFGVTNNILWLPDVFGYSAALPQILQGCEIPYFMTQKISWNQLNKFPHHTFQWRGIDGTEVLTHFLPADTYNSNMEPEQLIYAESNFKDKDRSNTYLYSYGFGDGGGGVTKKMLEMQRRMANLEGVPHVEPGFARDWYPQMEAEARDLRTWVGELYLELHRGTYTTQAKNKWENRRCEYHLRDAEFLAVVTGGEYPAAQLDEAWKLVLLNQFHDIIPGSSIHWVYEDSDKDYARVHALAQGAVDAAVVPFQATIDTSGTETPVLVWNTLSGARNGLVSLPWAGAAPAGTQLTAADELLLPVPTVPSLGYTVLDVAAVVPVSTVVTATGNVLENELLRVTLDENGALLSCYDKVAEREVLAQTGNDFQLFDDRPNHHQAWDIDLFYEETPLVITAKATLTVVEAGPLRASIKVERKLTEKATLVQYIRLNAGSRQVDFETNIDWQEEKKLLKVAFPVNVYAGHATFEIQYGHVERPTHRNTSWDVARFEVPAQKWVDLSESDYGVALLNNGKYGHDIHDNVMRLTLLRATKSPDEIADMGMHHFTYSLLPHSGDVTSSEVISAAYALNVPLLATQLPVQTGSKPGTHSYLSVDRDNLIIEAVKAAEDGDGIIVRLYEAKRSRGSALLDVAGLGITRVTQTNLIENAQQELAVVDGKVALSYRPFEIITLRLR